MNSKIPDDVKPLTELSKRPHQQLESFSPENEASKISNDIDIVVKEETLEQKIPSSNEGVARPIKKRFTTANDRRNHLKKNFAKRVGQKEEYQPRKWEKTERDTNETKDNSDIEEGSQDKEPRKPKRKVAALVGFCGTGYQGMQINPGAKTIEEELFKAFVAAGAISKDNSDDPKKVGLMRAARTDKGVHAAGNVISLKIS
ncbi:11324_t:CDS:2 [Ambispora leptoticha]|uniref:11324_t:CDS:1 n=1 Tax=Ambispora leptoticha TaxID=144679 RepID=A0A9N8Z489_9GLOM|nr:11324_t:CDS:2 [Ambispora leptoticha]